MTGNVVDSYFVCATPRTGSSLLLGLLQSTGVAGWPEAYFRSPDEQSWARKWQIPGPDDPGWDYRRFVRAAIAAGSTPNGVFGAKLMWGTLEELVAKASGLDAGGLRSGGFEAGGFDAGGFDAGGFDAGGFDAGGFEAGGFEAGGLQAGGLEVFGATRFVYLRRDDVLAQAVSWLRAEQTAFWYVGDTNANGHQPEYDEAAITGWIRTIEEHNTAWCDWFTAAGVTPHCVRYEDLAVDMVAVTLEVLDFLGLTLPDGVSIRPRHQRQADELSASWIARYRAAVKGIASAADGE